MMQNGGLQERRRFGIAAAIITVVAVLSVPAIFIAVKAFPQNEKMRIADNTVGFSSIDTTGNPTTIHPIEDTTALIERVVVNQNDYSNGLIDRIAIPKGEVYLSVGIIDAVDDPKNDTSYFYVYIDANDPDLNHCFGEYMYNGRTISQWAELVDLSCGTYPYSEYNGDHGGNVSVNEWERLQEEAKTLNTQENYDLATQEFNSEIAPLIKKEKEEINKAECDRLKQLGYDVWLETIFSHTNETEKEYFTILMGVLTKPQIVEFIANEDLGYYIDWVTNGDGTVRCEN